MPGVGAVRLRREARLVTPYAESQLPHFTTLSPFLHTPPVQHPCPRPAPTAVV
jgi:hypothetical protein